MKRKFNYFLGSVLLAALSLTGSAHTAENFNSRSGYTLNQIQQYLESACWSFNGFSINSSNWNPAIEGDGALVLNSNTGNVGKMYSPVLDIPGQVSLSFKYRVKTTGSARRYFRIYITDSYNTLLKRLDSVELTNINTETIHTYSQTFKNLGSGSYKIFISYTDLNPSAITAIDALTISATKTYEQGCNLAPVAQDDLVNGNSDRTASDYICGNDGDPDGEIFWPYIVTNSKDGNVEISDDGSFVFTPNSGFSGNSTSFTYRICDEGSNPLCSNEATVTINFPTVAMLPVSLVDFTGTYLGNGEVRLSWVTNFESKSDRFDIERSSDGVKWVKVGTKKAAGNSAIRLQYNFIDDAGKNRANKQDLYYRLKQVDLDGKVATGRILIVRVYNTRAVRAVSVTPNPAKNDIALSLELQQAAFVTIKIVNSNGTEVHRKSLKAIEGLNKVLVEGSSGLKPGFYILEVIINSRERMTVKLIKE